MNGNAKKGLLMTGPSQERDAVVAEATVAQPSDTPQQGSSVPVGTLPETDDTAAVRDYWFAAKKLYLRGEYDDYGSDSWKALDIEDPRKLAGLVAFAELWRKYSPEIADDLNRQLRAPESLCQRPTRAELDQAHRLMVAANRRSNRREAA